MKLDPFILSRIQFALNITFHIIFPSITIALGWILLFFKVRYQQTGKRSWLDNYFFFTKVFALSFALGIVSGITMSFQFGTNWPGFMKMFGNVAGPLLAYEILTAFFLEASFLGIMLFGMSRVPGWLHTGATFLVALGTTISAFWILVLNSWMHTPAGFVMLPDVSGALQAHVTSWFEVIFNPSIFYRLPHMLLASGLCASFLICGLSAYRLLKQVQVNAARQALHFGLVLAFILTPLQIFVGHAHGVHTHQVHPEKIAAIEAAWQTENGAPLILFALPNADKQANDYAIKIPKLGSLIVTHDLDGQLKGLKDFEEHPPVAPLFFGFRIMVGLGVLMLLVASVGVYSIWRDQTLPRPFYQLMVGMTFSGTIATIAGWYVTEIGRQPWLVYGLLRVKDALGSVGGQAVMSSLLLYALTFLFLGGAYVYTLFYLARSSGSLAKGDG